MAGYHHTESDDAAYAADAEGPPPSTSPISPGLSFRRQRSMKNREFGLFSNRLRRHDPPSKHDIPPSEHGQHNLVASDAKPSLSVGGPSAVDGNSSSNSSRGILGSKRLPNTLGSTRKNKFVFEDGEPPGQTTPLSNIPATVPPRVPTLAKSLSSASDASNTTATTLPASPTSARSPISPRWLAIANGGSTALYDQSALSAPSTATSASSVSASTGATSPLSPTRVPYTPRSASSGSTTRFVYQPYSAEIHTDRSSGSTQEFPAVQDSRYATSDDTFPPTTPIAEAFTAAAPISPTSPTFPRSPSSPTSTARSSDMLVDNFSRPRKASIKQGMPGSVPNIPLSTTISRLRQPEPLQFDGSMSTLPPSAQSSPWGLERARGMSVSSNQSSSTYSSIPTHPSKDFSTSIRYIAPSNNPMFPGATSPGLSRPPPAYNRIDAPSRQPNHPGPSSSTASGRPSLHPREPVHWVDDEEMRSSYRSQWTPSTAQGTVFTGMGTERSSIMSKASSRTSLSWYTNNGGVAVDEGLSVEDVMGMYEKGFADSTGTEDNDIDEANDGKALDGTINGQLKAKGPSKKTPLQQQSLPPQDNPDSLDDLNEPLPMPPPIGGASKTRRVPGAGLPATGIQEPGYDDSSLDAPHILRDSAAFFRNSGLPSSLPEDTGLALAAQNAKSRRHAGLKNVENQESDDDSELKRRDSAKMLGSGGLTPVPPTLLTPTMLTPTLITPDDDDEDRPPARIESSRPLSVFPDPPQPAAEDPNLRDRYGFRKQNHYITREQYDAWNRPYSEYIARRRRKWVGYLKDSGFITDEPNRFPAPNAKTKRFVRKGIPPEWRGAAWFYYAGGPAIVAKHPGIYNRLVRRAARGEANDVDIEAIERDLHRTFPDNIHFQFPPGQQPGLDDTSSTAGSSTQDAKTDGTDGGPAEAERVDVTADRPNQPVIISKLRRVLLAFSIYNPRIGYCQSLNFLAGLLLLFVETEEQCFWLLNVITRIYLPGTHDMSLEGSKVDLSVLMTELRESLPSVWSRIGIDLDDMPNGGQRQRTGTDLSRHGTRGRKMKLPRVGGNRSGATSPAETSTDNLPPITVCMTAWFMSCFIGTLPIETTLRVWDIFFYEGSKTLFRVALAIFKIGEPEIRAVKDPMEMFGVVQGIPRRLLDCNMVIDATFRRRNGFGHVSQENIDEKRRERRGVLKDARQASGSNHGTSNGDHSGDVSTVVTEADINAAKAGGEFAGTNSREELNATSEIHRKNTIFGRLRDRRPTPEAA